MNIDNGNNDLALSNCALNCRSIGKYEQLMITLLQEFLHLKETKK